MEDGFVFNSKIVYYYFILLCNLFYLLLSLDIKKII